MGYREEGVDAVGRDASAAVGVDCRGREHEIVLIWSLVSGKAHVSCLILSKVFLHHYFDVMKCNGHYLLS